MTQHWRYKFAVKKRKITNGAAVVVIDEAFFYANSEPEARAQYLETYGVEAGDLLAREPW